MGSLTSNRSSTLRGVFVSNPGMYSVVVVEHTKLDEHLTGLLEILKAVFSTDCPLNDAMVAFGMGILFRCSRPSKLVHDISFYKVLPYKIAFKLATIVRSHSDRFRHWVTTEDLIEQLHNVSLAD